MNEVPTHQQTQTFVDVITQIMINTAMNRQLSQIVAAIQVPGKVKPVPVRIYYCA